MSSTIFCLYVLLFHVSVLVYQIDSVPIQFRGNNRALQIATPDGVGQVLGPEDIAYDKKCRIIYIGCQDGFIKKVYIGKSNSSQITNVESWVNTGGRPLGVALGRNNDLIVADAYKGLLNVSKDGVELLTDEAEGVKFKLTEGVDVAYNGMIYFTDGSYKYNLAELLLELVENEAHGRFMSFDPVTRETKVLVPDIFFGNGVTVSPDQNYVVFCESLRSRCRKYHIRGPKIGLTENFIENLPGLPDNIRYDGQGHYWVGIFKDNTTIGVGGIVATYLDGKLLAYYSDFGLSIAGGIIIGDALFCGSLLNSYFVKFDLALL